MEMAKMELRNLLTFTHVAEQGSFTKAAELLGYSQSTISFQIKQVEEELDRIKAAGLNTITPMLVCNTDDYSGFNTQTGKAVTNADVVISLSK